MTVLFDGRRPHGDLDGCVRRLDSLLDPLKRLGPGKLPDLGFARTTSCLYRLGHPAGRARQ